MARIGLQQFVLLIGQPSHFLGQLVVSAPRTGQTHGASQLAATACPMILLRLLDQSIELATRDIPFDLGIPTILVPFEDPLSQLGEFGPRESFDLPFDSLDLGHGIHLSGGSIPPPPIQATCCVSHRDGLSMPPNTS